MFLEEIVQQNIRQKFFSVLIALILGLAWLGIVAPAQAVTGGTGTIRLTGLGITYTQNFDTLAYTTQTTHTLSIEGWYLDETSTNANGLYAGGTGSATTGDTYSFGTSGSTERAFGTLLSNSLTPMIGAQFTNNTGQTITTLSITYTGEQWRLGQSRASPPDRLDFQLSTTAITITAPITYWVDYDALDFSSPVTSGTVGALDGNAAANRTTLSYTITGLSIANGASFWIRWVDWNLSPGADDGLGIDDFSLTPNNPTAVTLSNFSAIPLETGGLGWILGGLGVAGLMLVMRPVVRRE